MENIDPKLNIYTNRYVDIVIQSPALVSCQSTFKYKVYLNQRNDDGPGSGSGKIPDPDPLSTKRPYVIQIFRYKIV